VSTRIYKKIVIFEEENSTLNFKFITNITKWCSFVQLLLSANIV